MARVEAAWLTISAHVRPETQYINTERSVSILDRNGYIHFVSTLSIIFGNNSFYLLSLCFKEIPKCGNCVLFTSTLSWLYIYWNSDTCYSTLPNEGVHMFILHFWQPCTYLIIPPLNEVERGVYWNEIVRLSMCLSVRLSVCRHNPVNALPGAILLRLWSKLVGTYLGARSRTSSFMGDEAH